VVFHKWWGNGLEEKYGQGLNEMAANYPDDIFAVFYNAPGTDTSTNSNPAYRFGYKKDYSHAAPHSIGKSVELLEDWNDLELLLKDFPNPNEVGIFDEVELQLKNAEDRYRLGCWWTLFHEMFWKIRGMENLMIDYYENMEELKILGRKILDFHKGIIDRYAALGFDGIFSSDDLGHQNGPMMSPATFEELYLPLYKELSDHLHSKGMHFFLHSCGDNTKLMEYLIEAGVDVFHPVQKGCMDEVETAKKYGNRITFLVGADVQHLLPEGTASEVSKGIKEVIDIFHKPEGGLLMAAGNGIMPDTPLENIKEMLEVISLYK